MMKYWITGILALMLILVCSDKVLADAFTQTPTERVITLKNWETSLVGTTFSESNTDLMNLLRTKENNFKKSTLDTFAENKEMLFTDKPKTLSTGWASAQWTIMAQRIEEMAVLYKTPNSKYYNDKELGRKIIYSLQWYNDNIYSDTIKVNGSNWYDNQIATPLSLVNTLVLMGNTDEQTDESNKIPSELLQKYMLAFDYFEPPTYNGTSASGAAVGTAANRINKGFVVVMRGIIGSDTDKTQVGIDMLRRGYLTVTTGDGFYSDGTFIQHENVPYTTGYGADALARFADLFRLFEGTKGMSAYTGSSAIFNLLDIAYAPALYKNETLDMTRGRTIAIPSNKSENMANTILYDIYTISKRNLVSIKTYKNLVKSSIFERSSKADFYASMTIPEAQTFQELLQDSSTSSEYLEEPKNIMMSRASQMIDQKPGYKAGLSMFSKNVSAFEYLSDTNLLGFYTGAGALSLYNGDDAFKGNYYPTVGMTSLPGTTTDLKTRDLKAEGAEENKLYPNTESWTGGITDKTNGSATMDYSMKEVTDSNLKASKSWFFLDGKIVAMGNGITNAGGPNTQTIVENRQLLNSSNTFSVNGQNISLSDPTSQINNAKWAHLDGATPSQNIGYVFPYPTNVSAYKREQSGNWMDLSTRNTQNNKTVTSTYAGLTIPHGANPSNASYMYMILPGSSKENTEKVATDPGVLTINTNTVQGVLDKEHDLAIMNYRAPGEAGYPAATKHNFNSQAHTSGSIMIRYATKEDKQTKTITLADPSMAADSIHFSIPKESFNGISSQSEKGTVTSVGDSWDITVDTSGKTGESFQFTFEEIPSTLVADNFTIGASYVTGAYTGDVAKVELKINGALIGKIPASNPLKYYAKGKITSITDTVSLISYDSKGKQLKEIPIIVKPTPATLTTVGFTIGVDSYVQGTYTGDLFRVALEVDGVINGKIPVSNSAYQYYAAKLIKSTATEVYMVGYDSSGAEVTRVKVDVQSKPDTIIVNDFTVGKDSYVTGSYTGGVAKIALEVNGKLLQQPIGVAGSPYRYYANGKFKASDEVYVIFYVASDLESNRVKVIVK
ncbi:polysaccharide lyase 8 family protein [Listeria weihenstephanensis]|uniref:Polysaccharide lyase 8 family protein n=1 Tax=Listeria weihenstephanensis TaxID=1006155 RepID=A0A841Z8L0_9LIST|nr:polysaccharide lyase 8 family protein [Listeria weihenstephanensis]MBC1501550.1 polysaccharide lyase 8 family protein [Listeria weihenstephanensis]